MVFWSRFTKCTLFEDPSLTVITVGMYFILIIQITFCAVTTAIETVIMEKIWETRH